MSKMSNFGTLLRVTGTSNQLNYYFIEILIKFCIKALKIKNKHRRRRDFLRRRKNTIFRYFSLFMTHKL